MGNNIADNANHLIYGLNNCISFLKSNFFSKSIDISINNKSVASKNKELFSLLDKRKIKIKYFGPKEFRSKFNIKHDQGIVINFKGSLIKNIIDINHFPENSCYLICDQINDPQNLGQILRTCECAGVDGIILPKHGSVHITDSVIQVSQGALFYSNIFIETNLNNTIKYLKSKGFWIIGVENSIQAKNWYKMDYKGKIAIVLGSEGRGIRDLVKKSCDFLATIPMKGNINSLNITAAASAVLFERQRQLDLINKS